MTKVDPMLVLHACHDLAMALLLVRTQVSAEQPSLLFDFAELMAEEERL